MVVNIDEKNARVYIFELVLFHLTFESYSKK